MKVVEVTYVAHVGEVITASNNFRFTLNTLFNTNISVLRYVTPCS